MPNKILYFILFITSWILGSAGPILTNDFKGDLIYKIMQSIGAASGLFVMAGIPVFLGKLCFGKFMKRGNNFVIVWIVFVLIIGTLIIKGHLYNKENQQGDYIQISSVSNPSTVRSANESNESIDKRSEGSLYRNADFQFRIIFPKDWKVSDGEGENTIKKAEWNNIASINIAARKGPNNINSNDISDQELIDFGKASIQPSIERLGGEILTIRTVYINNHKAVHLQARVVYKKLDGDFQAINNQYLMLKNGLLYIITTSCLEIRCIELEDSFKDSVDSFIIEDWD